MKQIDTHLHVWNPDRLPYHWLTGEQPALFRSILLDEVYPQMQNAGIEAAVLVEAANLTAEIPFLLQLAKQHDWISGVVGWMSEEDQIRAQPNARMRGARIPAVSTESTPVLPQAIERYGLVCDLIIAPDAYAQAHALITSHPATTFVLDHFAGAAITTDGVNTWRKNAAVLAALPNVVLKLSGYLTAAEPKPLSFETLRRYVDAAVELFGAKRLMYGSDYPICTLAGSYEQTVLLMRQAIAHLSGDEQAQIMGGTAIRVYGLETV